MLFIIGFIFLAVAGICLSLGSIFNYLGAAKEFDEEFKDEEIIVDDETETEEAAEE